MDFMQALPALLQALRAQNPGAAQEVERWSREGGSLPASALMALIAVAPAVGVPAAAIMAGVRSAQPGAQTGTDQGTRQPAFGQGPARGAVALGGSNPAQVPQRAPGPTPQNLNEVTPASVGVVTPPTPSPGGATGPLDPDNPFRAPGMPPAVNPTRPSASPTTLVEAPPPTGAQVPNTPGGSAFRGNMLAESDDQLARFAMMQAGFNPDIITRGSKVAMRNLIPIIEAYRAAFGAGAGQNSNVEGLPDFIAQAAKQYTSGTGGFYGNARKYAESVMGSPDFASFLSKVGDQDEQFGMMQALVPLLYGGSNPMVQQSVADQLKSLFGQFGDDEYNRGTNNTLTEFLTRNRDKLSPALRNLFGPLTR